MKKIILMAIVVFGAVTMQAQEADKKKHTAKDKIERKMQHLNEVVELTEEQDANIRVLYNNQFKEIKPIRESEINDEVKQEKIKTIKKSYKEKIMAELTPEQKEKLKAARKHTRYELHKSK